jgi:hypothetical protein
LLKRSNQNFTPASSFFSHCWSGPGFHFPTSSHAAVISAAAARLKRLLIFVCCHKPFFHFCFVVAVRPGFVLTTAGSHIHFSFQARGLAPANLTMATSFWCSSSRCHPKRFRFPHVKVSFLPLVSFPSLVPSAVSSLVLISAVTHQDEYFMVLVLDSSFPWLAICRS